MAKSTLQKHYVVSKRNVLNEMRTTNMTIQELRLFSIYLSKVNPKDPSTRRVRFRLDDFQAIMEYKGRVHMPYFKAVTDNLFAKIISVPDEKGNGLYRFPFFKECQLGEDDDGRWFIELDANDRALPFIFEYQNNYFKYELWNALRLKGKNQLRMYEILKQYERLGHRIISVASLKEQLGIEENEYPQFKIFKRAVLEPCREALAELTDISFTYEAHRKIGRKTHELKFIITKNKNHKDPLSLGDFIDMKNITYDDDVIDIWDMDLDDIDPDSLSRYDERLLFFRDAVEGAFTKEQMIVLCDLMTEKMQHIFHDDLKSYNYLRRKLNELKLRESQGEILSRFGYMKSLIGTK